jgi:GNAT superfamily N-acetyltransferase
VNPPLRVAGPGDVDALLDLWRRAESAPSVTDKPEDVARVVTLSHARVLVAVDEGVVVGSIVATFDGWRGNLYRMAVDPAYRRRGLALELVAAAEEWLQAQGAKRISALVVDAGAGEFWSAAGFHVYDGMLRYVKSV